MLVSTAWVRFTRAAGATAAGGGYASCATSCCTTCCCRCTCSHLVAAPPPPPPPVTRDFTVERPTQNPTSEESESVDFSLYRNTNASHARAIPSRVFHRLKQHCGPSTRVTETPRKGLACGPSPCVRCREGVGGGARIPEGGTRAVAMVPCLCRSWPISDSVQFLRQIHKFYAHFLHSPPGHRAHQPHPLLARGNTTASTWLPLKTA